MAARWHETVRLPQAIGYWVSGGWGGVLPTRERDPREHAGLRRGDLGSPIAEPSRTILGGATPIGSSAGGEG